MRIETDIVNMEMVADDGGRIPAQYQDFTISRFVISLWDTRTIWTDAAQICQLSHRTYHGMQREFARKSDSVSRTVGTACEETTWLPGLEEALKLGGSTKSLKERVRPRAGKDRHRLRWHRSQLWRRTADCGCVGTTELSMRPRWRTDILSNWSRRCSTGAQEFLSPHPNQRRQRVEHRISHPVQAVREPSHDVWVDKRTSYHTTQVQHQIEEISHRQSNDV